MQVVCWHRLRGSSSKFVYQFSNASRPKLGMRFIRLCMRVEIDSVIRLKMVQSKEIKMTYLLVVVFLI